MYMKLVGKVQNGWKRASAAFLNETERKSQDGKFSCSLISINTIEMHLELKLPIRSRGW